MPYSPSLIAYTFVKKGIEESKPVTQMKLQKLVYFAHGLHLAEYDEPLINQFLQAWRYGPVAPEIYKTYNLYGNGEILDLSYAGIFGRFTPDTSILNESAINAINSTWQSLKDIDAIKLSNWTHKEGSPWAKNYQSGFNRPIPDSEIKSFFKSLLQQTS